MVHIQNPTAGEVETDQSLEVNGQPEPVSSRFNVKVPQKMKWSAEYT